jgi:hypothetical protein
MEDRWSLDEPSRKSTRTLVFSYRVVNDLWKRSFSVCSCEASFVQALSADDGKRLEASVLSDAKLMKDWERYQAKTKLPDLIANLPFGELKEIEGFSKLCDEMLANRIDSGVTVDEVLSLLRERGLDGNMRKFPQQATLQLISNEHELRGDEFVHRRYRTLMR